jgi:hypothetical protein
MKKNIELCIGLSVLIFSISCAFVQNLILPSGDNPTPVPEFSDEPQPITCSDDACLDLCLNRLDEVLETSPFDGIGNSIYEEQNTDFNLVIYQVDGNQISDPAVLYVPPDFKKYQDDTGSHQRIWDFYTAIIPPELREMVHEFVIYTDGSEGGSGAWVNQSGRDPNQWQVGFDLLDSEYPPYLADAVVHETGHLLTLNTGQMPFNDMKYFAYDPEQKVFQGCTQYANESACSTSDSYINLFYEQFWKDTYPEWWQVQQEALNAETDEEYYQVMGTFYENHESLFLNDYAATNIKEDLAESFSYFVLNPKPEGNSVPEQKINFYYEFPELVKYRHQIIEGLCSYVN